MTIPKVRWKVSGFMIQSGRKSFRVVKGLDLNGNQLPVCEMAAVLDDAELLLPPAGVAAPPGGDSMCFLKAASAASRAMRASSCCPGGSFFICSSIVCRLRRRRRCSRSQARAGSGWQGITAGLTCFPPPDRSTFLPSRFRREPGSVDAEFRVIVLRSHSACALSSKSVGSSKRSIHCS